MAFDLTRVTRQDALRNEHYDECAGYEDCTCFDTCIRYADLYRWQQMIYKGETMPDLTIESRWYCKDCGWDEETDGGHPEDAMCPQCESKNLDTYRVAV